MESSQALAYLECTKTGYHFGQALNVVCLEAGCIEKALCCSACVQEQHKKHQTKPLKLVISQAKEHSTKLKPIAIDTEAAINQLKAGQQSALQCVKTAKKKVDKLFADIDKCLTSYYSSMQQQIRLKTVNSQGDIQKIFEEVKSTTDLPALLEIVKKIVSLIPKKDSTNEPVKEAELMESLTRSNKEIKNQLDKICNQLITRSQTNFADFEKMVLDFDIWQPLKFKFSSKLKHAEIKLQGQFIAKSGTTAGYKFAIMEPDIEKNKGIKNMAWKIKEANANWLAVGVCHKNVVQSKNFGFSFNVLGHGAYMVSSNGGSWSDTRADVNNCVKAFKFAKGDIVMMVVNFQTKKIKFSKKSSAQSYVLDFLTNPNDPLHPCVLFYYANDQVEYLPDFKDWS